MQCGRRPHMTQRQPLVWDSGIRGTGEMAKADESAPAVSLRQLSDDKWSHHVVLFVLEDVAVPHVFMAAGPRALGIAHGRR